MTEPDISKRMFAMYHSKADECDKEQILASLRDDMRMEFVEFFSVQLPSE